MFWMDPWIHEKPLSTLLTMQNQSRVTNSKVADFWDINVGWKWEALTIWVMSLMSYLGCLRPQVSSQCNFLII